MSLIKELCRVRAVCDGLNTPFLLPSFSSKGIPHIKHIYQHVKPFFMAPHLVSAYDIYYDFTPLDDLFFEYPLVVDSGGYEANQHSDLFELSSMDGDIKSWTAENHEAILQQLLSKAGEEKIIAVNFDLGASGKPLVAQIKNAQEFQQKFPDCIIDFLVKPSCSAGVINVDDILSNIGQIKEFHVLGLTEKELGNGVEERIGNLIKLRRGMNAADVHIPIHIFGCFDPYTIIAFVNCGADIFDGLSWLRYFIHNHVPTYKAVYPYVNSHVGLSDIEIDKEIIFKNYSYFDTLSDKIVKFVQTLDWECFGDMEGVENVRRVLKQEGVID